MTRRNSKCKKTKAECWRCYQCSQKNVNRETLAADQEQNLARVSKAGIFINMTSGKEKTLRELTDAEKKLEKEFKSI